jgi:hypothetical protein
MKGISSLTYLTENISQEDKKRCLNVFIENNFLTYNYQNEKHENAALLLSENYLKRKRYLLLYQTEDFAFTCSNEKNYLTYSVDGDNEHSKIILKVSEQFSKILSNLVFSYIDNSGDNPDNLDTSVNKLLLDNLFKFNYFGLQYLEKYGKSFFENFPAKQVKFISNKIVRINLVDEVFDEISIETKEKVRMYLSKNGIFNVEFYNASKYQY